MQILALNCSTPITLYFYSAPSNQSFILFPNIPTLLPKMTLQPVLPNELMLLLFQHQTTIPDLLALSSASRTMRSLFLDNASSMLSAVCKNTDLLSAAKVLVDIISGVAKLDPVTCICEDYAYHFHKNVANQHYIADGRAPYPIELRDLRTTSRVLNTAMLIADKAIEFWTARAATCPIDHKPPTVDKEKFAQAYFLLWACAESHFSSELDARARKLGSDLSHREIMLLRELYEFISFDLDWSAKLSTGSADPEDDEDEDIIPERVWFELIAGGERLEHNYDPYTNSLEWTFWGPRYASTWYGVSVPHGNVTEWEGEKPAGCHCPKVTWIQWDLIQMNWWHTWNRMA
jgi:hypothetical protein